MDVAGEVSYKPRRDGEEGRHRMKWFSKAQAFLAIVLAILLICPFGCKKEEPQAKEIKIGAILPLSGGSAQYGIWIKEALELGREEIDAKGGINGKPLVILYEDDQADPKIAANAMQKLAAFDRVPVVYGSWASSCVLAQAPIAEKTKTVVIGEAISPKIRDAGDYVFRMQPDARYYVRQLVPFVRHNLKISKVTTLYVNNDFGSDQAKVFSDEFEKLGGRIFSSDAFEQGATDFKTELTKVKAENPEAIFCPAYTEIAVILRQAKELGITQQFFASVPFENPDIVKAAGDAAEGVIYPHHFDSDSTDSDVRDYQRRYRAKYGHSSEGFGALAYDGIYIIAHVLKEYGESADGIKEGLYNVKNFRGVTGETAFDSYGDVIKPIIIKTVRNGRFVRYER